MKNYFPINLLLMVLLLFNTNQVSGGNYVKESVTVDNLRETLQEIRLYYEATFSAGQAADINMAMAAIEAMFIPLFTTHPFSATCTPGPFQNISFYPSTNPNSGGYDFVVEWENSLSTSTNYYAAFLDLVNLSVSGQSTSALSNVVLELPSFIDKKLYIFNGRCVNEQSSYFIIIVEKDLDFSSLGGTFGSLPNGGGPGQEDPPSTSTPPSNPHILQTDISVFPNPSVHAPVNIEFNLPVPQTISLELYHAQTGVLMQTIFSQQYFNKGFHSERVSLANLPAGIYYLRMRSRDQELVERLVRF